MPESIEALRELVQLPGLLDSTLQGRPIVMNDGSRPINVLHQQAWLPPEKNAASENATDNTAARSASRTDVSFVYAQEDGSERAAAMIEVKIPKQQKLPIQQV